MRLRISPSTNNGAQWKRAVEEKPRDEKISIKKLRFFFHDKKKMFLNVIPEVNGPYQISENTLPTKIKARPGSSIGK